MDTEQLSSQKMQGYWHLVKFSNYLSSYINYYINWKENSMTEEILIKDLQQLAGHAYKKQFQIPKSWI